MSNRFDPSIVLFRGRAIECRYDNIRSPILRPQIRVQVLNEAFSGEYGPIQIIFDLYNIRDGSKSKPLAFANRDGSKSKPLAFANLTYPQLLKLISELIKAASVYVRQLTPDEIWSGIKPSLKVWYRRNYVRIIEGALVEG